MPRYDSPIAVSWHLCAQAACLRRGVRVAIVPAAVSSFSKHGFGFVLQYVICIPDAISHPCLRIAQWFPVVDSVKYGTNILRKKCLYINI